MQTQLDVFAKDANSSEIVNGFLFLFVKGSTNEANYFEVVRLYLFKSNQKRQIISAINC